MSGWTCEWAAPEDDKLLIGIWRHGFGNWEAIRDDAELGLKDRLFLDEPKTKVEGATKSLPNPIHLVRRGDYLLQMLCEHLSADHTSASPPTASEHAAAGSSDAPVGKGPSAGSPPEPATNGKKKAPAKQKPRRKEPAAGRTPSSEPGRDAAPLPQDMPEEARLRRCKEMMKKVKDSLKELREDRSRTLENAERGAPPFSVVMRCLLKHLAVAVLKAQLTAIGSHIENVVVPSLAVGQQQAWRTALWEFGAQFFPRPIEASRLRGMYEK